MNNQPEPNSCLKTDMEPPPAKRQRMLVRDAYCITMKDSKKINMWWCLPMELVEMILLFVPDALWSVNRLVCVQWHTAMRKWFRSPSLRKEIIGPNLSKKAHRETIEWAADHKKGKLMQWLVVGHGARPKGIVQQSKWSRIACNQEFLPLVQCLASLWTSVEWIDKYGEPNYRGSKTLDVAARTGRVDIIEALTGSTSPVTRCHAAFASANMEMIFLLNGGDDAHLYGTGFSPTSAAREAARGGKLILLQSLIDTWGADLLRVVHNAVRYGQLVVVQWLLELYDSNILLNNKTWYMAVKGGHIPTLDYLYQHESVCEMWASPGHLPNIEPLTIIKKRKYDVLQWLAQKKLLRMSKKNYLAAIQKRDKESGKMLQWLWNHDHRWIEEKSFISTIDKYAYALTVRALFVKSTDALYWLCKHHLLKTKRPWNQNWTHNIDEIMKINQKLGYYELLRCAHEVGVWEGSKAVILPDGSVFDHGRCESHEHGLCENVSDMFGYCSSAHYMSDLGPVDHFSGWYWRKDPWVFRSDRPLFIREIDKEKRLKMISVKKKNKMY